MVHKYPPTKDELKGRRESVPHSELKFYELVDGLSDEWHVWHSVQWNKEASTQSGEIDFLLFNPKYGYVVIEVKGGLISVENNCFYTTNFVTGQKFPIGRDPFSQAENSLHHIRQFYIKRAKLSTYPNDLLDRDCFPLNFNYAVFFPDCNFKEDNNYLQYSFDQIFDESDLDSQLEWQSSGQTGLCPLESFLINLLNRYKRLRVIKPKVEDFFVKMIGSNISKVISIKKYYDIREQELQKVNEVQDFLLDALAEKKYCVFRGSAGSGKTFVAMKKGLLNYHKGINTLILCFNAELSASIKNYLSLKIGKYYSKIKGLVTVYSINAFIRKLIKVMFDADTEQRLAKDLLNFSYGPIADKIREKKNRIPVSMMYDAILIDEAQDIDVSLWDLFVYFLKNTKESIFYVFYDNAQAIFVKDFSPHRFGMDEKSDLIVLNRNLRNTVEIANWFARKTTYGIYDVFSGINGFKISTANFSSVQEALTRALDIIKKKYYTQEIILEQIIILSYYKLSTLYPNVKNNELCDYYFLTDKTTGKKMHLIEPKTISSMEQITHMLEFKNAWCTLFKTISSFKGLERDIVFLIVPNLNEFKQQQPDMWERFLMQIYVGASRAKFKLYFFEYTK